MTRSFVRWARNAFRWALLLAVLLNVSSCAKCSGMSTLDDIDVVFDALAHETRRHVLLLLSHLGGELPSGYLAKRFQHSWPTTTRHLGVLEKAGLIEVRREGRGSHYRINRERLQRVVGGWLDNLTPPTPDR